MVSTSPWERRHLRMQSSYESDNKKQFIACGTVISHRHDCLSHLAIISCNETPMSIGLY